jgi:hypothetical protein
MYFSAELAGSDAQPDAATPRDAATLRDAAGLARFAPDELPEAIAFDHAHQVLKDCVEHVKRE